MARPCRVLVVEDNGDVRELLRDVFDWEGYRFETAEDGDAMRRALAGGDVDVVVIDVHLRGGRGGESALDLAGAAAEAGCAVVLTTGDPQQIPRIEASGRRYIRKPYRLEALIDTVEAALDEARARCETKRRRRRRFA